MVRRGGAPLAGAPLAGAAPLALLWASVGALALAGRLHLLPGAAGPPAAARGPQGPATGGPILPRLPHRPPGCPPAVFQAVPTAAPLGSATARPPHTSRPASAPRLSLVAAAVAGLAGLAAAGRLRRRAGAGERWALFAVADDAGPSQAAAMAGYQLPPPSIAAMVDAPKPPTLRLSPSRDFVLLCHQPALPSILAIMDEPVKLAGLRFHRLNAPVLTTPFYTRLLVQAIGPLETLAPDAAPGPSREVRGLPASPVLRDVSFNHKGTRFAFTHFDAALGVQLYTVDTKTWEAQLVPLPARLNDTLCDVFAWLNDDELAVATVSHPGPPPEVASAAPVPVVTEHAAGKKAAAPTYQDLLKSPADEQLFVHYCTSSLVRVTLPPLGSPAAPTVGPLGPPPQLYTSMSVSPDGGFLLLKHHHAPFSYRVPVSRFPLCVEVWRLGSEAAAPTTLHATLCDLPLADCIPIAFDACRVGIRGTHWRRDRPHTVVWVEAQDGGDPQTPEAELQDGVRDVVFALPISPALPPGSPDWAGHKRTIAALRLRYDECTYGEAGFLLVEERWKKTRTSRLHVVPTVGSTPAESATTPTPEEEEEGYGPMTLLVERSYEDRYNSPGDFVLHRGRLGTLVLATLPAEDAVESPAADDGPAAGPLFPCRLLLQGAGASEAGDRPFLDAWDLSRPGRPKRRLWRSPTEQYYDTTSALLGWRAVDGAPTLWLLSSRESLEAPPNYFVRRVAVAGDEASNAAQPLLSPLTANEHPYPALRGLRRELVRYARADGVGLTATLHLPPTGAGPFPLLMWAYPKEFKTREAAAQTRESPFRFTWLGWGDPLFHLAEGYAVLANVAMPIVGEGDAEPNDTYVPQLVANAEAAVEEMVRRGVADPSRIAIGGHSYGAFMVANLLSHCDRFTCGIARSGAYNRTLTPFGFQQEDRPFWQCVDTYVQMSPFAHADKVTAPLLLIHGMEDKNTGTHTMQSERYFAALQGNGKAARLVLLPHESHHYRARESVLHMLAEQHGWLTKHCLVVPPSAP